MRFQGSCIKKCISLAYESRAVVSSGRFQELDSVTIHTQETVKLKTKTNHGRRKLCFARFFVYGFFYLVSIFVWILAFMFSHPFGNLNILWVPFCLTVCLWGFVHTVCHTLFWKLMKHKSTDKLSTLPAHISTSSLEGARYFIHRGVCVHLNLVVPCRTSKRTLSAHFSLRSVRRCQFRQSILRLRL